MTYIFVITLLVLQTLVVRTLTLNVRTTLFTTADLAKKKWNKRDVALLKARMYLQDLIPPIEVSQNPEYASFLIRYIQDCYTSVNREAFDPEMEAILKDAVSDVFGGYLKMVALPVTKYVYYSGYMPTKEALQLFKYYNDIKRHLRTRGASWSEQIPNIIKTKFRGTRSNLVFLKVNNPCQQLLHLQNTRHNISMPMPSIDWNTRMMFVPLTNQPIVDLLSPYVEPVLLKYHQTATACERSISPYQHCFQNLFEQWANQAVVPHLTDEDLYTAFQGILGLIDNVSTTPYYEEKSNMFTKHFNMSTTSIIVATILILEITCCIPTLVYLIKKKKGSSTSTEKSFDKTPCICHSELQLARNSGKKRRGKRTSTVNFIDYKKTSEANSDFMSTMSATRCSYTSITDLATVVDEAPMKKVSHRDNNIQPSYIHLLHYKDKESVNVRRNDHQAQVSSSVLAPQATSTFTAVNLDTASTTGVSNETGETVTLSTVQGNKGALKLVRESKRFRKHTEATPNRDPHSPKNCSRCTFPTLGDVKKVLEKSKNLNTAEDLKLDIYKNTQWEGVVMQDSNPQKVDCGSPNISISLTTAKIGETRYNQSNVSKTKRTKLMKVLNKVRILESQHRPNAEETRKRKQQTNTEMPRQVIPQYAPNIEIMLVKNKEETARTVKKPSRIPKKLNTYAPKDTSSRSTPSPSSPKRRSLIPKPTRTQDDAAIRPASAHDSKLNITL